MSLSGPDLIADVHALSWKSEGVVMAIYDEINAVSRETAIAKNPVAFNPFAAHVVLYSCYGLRGRNGKGCY